MFTTGTRGYRPSCVFIVIVVFSLGSWSVYGKPQSYQKSTQPTLKFSPELMLEPSLESAVSPISLLPRNPSRDSSKPPTPNKHSEIPNEDPPDLSLDLDGPQEKWEQDPDILDSDILPPRRWDNSVPDPPKNKVVVPPNLEDDVDVDRLHGQLFGFLDEDSDEDLGVPEAWQRAKIPRSYHRAAETGSGYGPLPNRDAGEEIPSPQFVDKDVEIDKAMAPPYSDIPISDDVPAFPARTVPWNEMFEKDVDIDRPIRHDSSVPKTRPTTAHGKTLSQWKELALAGLAADEDMILHGGYKDVAISDIDVDKEKSPFDDDEDDEEVDEVPEELVRQVVEALEARPTWRESPTPKQERELQAKNKRRIGDSDEDDEYYDWLPRRRAEPQNSRLIALIYQTVDAPNDILKDSEDDDLYEDKINIWQILTNFPFPMLVGHSDDHDITEAFDDDYDEEYYDDYDEDEDDYDEDDYDEDDYDEEDYEDEEEDEDDDDVENGKSGVTQENDLNNPHRKDREKESDETDDFFYEYEYEDCDDCSEDDDDDGVRKEDFTVLSLPPIFTK